MQIAFEVIKILNDGKFHSGVQLAERLRVSRTSIWKAVQHLEKLGISIDAVRAKGYRLYQPLELLNKPEIFESLSPECMSALNRFEVLQAIPSTNDYLLAQIPYGLKSFSACVSEAQTRGKGRQGKIWQSPFGRNIYLSIYWKSHTVLRGLSGLSLVIAMAVLSAFESFSALPTGLGIKWPNDIYYQNKKMGGILIETQSDTAASQTHVVIGIGLNMSVEPIHQISWTGINDVLPEKLSRNLCCGRILEKTMQAIERFKQEGFASFCSEWPKHDLLREKPVTIAVGDSEESGICLGVNERGELLVSSQNNLRALTYGEVSIRPDCAIIN